ncbi:MAG: RND family transporter [Chitinispirillaceae bacterium]|nr:RND family transporter [Chitinispirillaceae bacterium]
MKNALHAFKYPGISIIATLAITFFFAWHLPKLIINNDVVVFLPKNNPHRAAYDALNEEFDKSDGIIIAATVKKGFIYSTENVSVLKVITDSLQAIDSVEGVMALTTTDYVEGIEGGVETVPIAGEVPDNPQQEQDILNRLKNWDIYRNTLYTDDYKTSLILIRLKSNSMKRDEAIYHEAMRITSLYHDKFDFQVAGSPSIFILVGKNMTSDLSRLIPFVIIMVLLALWISFRRAGGIILPMLTVLISIIWSLGLMSLVGIQMTLIATVIPVLLVAVGSAYGIHILAHYYDNFAQQCMTLSGSLSEVQHEHLLDSTMNSVGRAVMLAALTTMAGFGSLATSSITPVRDFGIFTFVGVFAAFIVSIVLIPSLLHFAHSKNTGKIKKDTSNPLIDPLVNAFEKIARRPAAVFAATLLTIVIAIIGTSRVRVGNAIINFFKENSSVWQANSWLQKHTNGTSTLNVVIRGKEAGDLARPLILKKIDEFGTFLKSQHSNVKKTGSLVDIIKRINDIMHIEEQKADSSVPWNEIPTDPVKYGLDGDEELKQLISQYLMLFTGDIEQFADDGIEPKIARILLQMNTNEVDTLRSIQRSVTEWFGKNLPEGYTFEVAGTADAELEVNRLIVTSQINSIITSIVVVFGLIALAYGSLWAGLYGAVCLAIPLLINFGVMGILGIRLDIATAMVSSIAIGIGIDYIIHYMSAYTRELRANGMRWEGVSARATRSCGRAIIFNAASVALGFAIILLSNFKPLNYLGALIFLSMGTSSLVSLTLLPVLFDHFKPQFLLRTKS